MKNYTVMAQFAADPARLVRRIRQANLKIGRPVPVKTYGIAYIATALVFVGMDAVWLTLAAQRLYRPLMGNMLLERFNLVPALLFYTAYIGGIVFFAVSPALHSGRWTTAALYGALLGLFAYGTYDLTNQATLRGWPVAVTIADLCWGIALTAFAAAIGYLVTRTVA